jgi:hypothetical protein
MKSLLRFVLIGMVLFGGYAAFSAKTASAGIFNPAPQPQCICNPSVR